MATIFFHMFSMAANDQVPGPDQLFMSVFAILPVLMVVYLVVTCLLLCWFYSMGVNLYKRLPPAVSMPIGTFKAFIIILLCQWFVMMPAGIYFMHIMPTIFNNPHPETVIFRYMFIPILLMPLQLFCAFCMFYCFYFIAKCLKAVEKQKDVTVGDYIGEFFLLWFWFVGVWLIQPKINKLFAEDTNPQDQL